MQDYRDESLSVPGLVKALQLMGSNTTISSAVSALNGFKAAHRSTWIRKGYVRGCEESNGGISTLLQLP